MDETPSAVELQQVCKQFGSFVAVGGVSLSIAPGEIVGLLGASGCGKTTTLRCIAGLEQPTSGSIHIGGRTVFSEAKGVNVKTEKRGLGMVFQSYALWPHLTVAENVGLPLKYCGLDSAARTKRTQDALAAVGLEAFANRYPSELSGGQQQRVCVARAIAPHPPLLLFDEPLSNLDVKLRNELRIELKGLLRRLGATAVYVTHDQREAMALCDRIGVMRTGKILQLGTAEDVYRRPKHEYVARFVGQANVFPVVTRSAGMDRRIDAPIRLGVDDFMTAKASVDEIARGTGLLAARPEDVSIVHDPPGEANWSFDGTVLEALYVGSHTEYVVRLNASGVVLNSHCRARGYGPGDRCVVVIDKERVSFVRADDEGESVGLGEGTPPAGSSGRWRTQQEGGTT